MGYVMDANYNYNQNHGNIEILNCYGQPKSVKYAQFYLSPERHLVQRKISGLDGELYIEVRNFNTACIQANPT